jgi:neopullulanase
MKRTALISCFFFLAASLSAAITVTRMDPAFWWVGMKNPELQIMVYGPDVGKSQVAVQTPGVILKKVVKAESPDYLFLYLDLSQATPGQVKFLFTEGKHRSHFFYELKARTVAPESHKGFSTSDVLYLLMPDRFANGDPANDNLPMKQCSVSVNRKDSNARHGGDLAGIAQHLDYIADLGVTAIWLNPVLENDMPGGSYHGYATTDYYRIDPRFGTNAEYANLISLAHSKNLKVVMDMIFNHVGSEHIWLKDMPFSDWFHNGGKFVQTNHDKFVSFDPYASAYDSKRMTDGWFVESMPDLNQRNPQLARYLIQNSIWWVEYAGIDGIRQDTHPYADADMMSQWCKELMTEYPNFNIVGEAWINYQPGIAYWQAGSRLNTKGNSNLKTVMDFPLMLMSNTAFNEETNWDKGLTRIYEHLCFDFLYPDVNNLLVFLENHDTNRFLLEMPVNLAVFKQAYAFLLTSRGIPQLYYGSEILMNGTKKTSDGDVRKDFPGGWPGDAVNAFVPEGRTLLQNEAHDYLKKLLTWRRGNDVIAKGSLKHFVPLHGAYVYFRENQGKKVLVVLNGLSRENTIALDPYSEVLGNIHSGKDVITGKTVSLEKELRLAPRETLILEL